MAQQPYRHRLLAKREPVEPERHTTEIGDGLPLHGAVTQRFLRGDHRMERRAARHLRPYDLRLYLSRYLQRVALPRQPRYRPFPEGVPAGALRLETGGHLP